MDLNQMFEQGFFSHFTEIMNEATQSDGQNGLFIGMMSGTSLDGLDAVLCQFHAINEDNDEPVEILATISRPFPDDLRQVLLALCQPNEVLTLIEQKALPFFSELDVFGWAGVYYAEFASEVVKQLLQQVNAGFHEVSAIGCHGQTVRHRPQWNFSLQLLDPNVLAERTGIAVVSDFRRRDMAVGGQGAPLVPAFHQAMFAHITQATNVVLNLGGIANITILDGTENVMGFDTGVANLLLDAWCQRHTGQSFDDNGNWAATGQVIEPLLSLLLSHPFFALPAPKSTGREEFHLAWVDDLLEKIDIDFPNLNYSPADVQATLTELTAISVAKAILQSVNDQQLSPKLFVCGGGAFNGYLIQRLQWHLPNWQINTTEALGIAPLWVESLAFAWLAKQTLDQKNGNLPSVTGATKPVILGQICF